jgi:2-amino-4-hydroxy-6-hydroxymethyldihydropteridine diphosphokinase
MIETAYIGIGSNLGKPLENCLKAIQIMDDMQGCRLVGRSEFYRTEPVGVEGQEWYLNGVVSLETERAPAHLLQGLMAIETEMGRVRKEKWEARVIDLDLLLYGDLVIDEPGLKVPHPRMHERKFVLIPIVDLSPNLLHPVFGRRMIDLLKDCAEEGQQVLPVDGQ